MTLAGAPACSIAARRPTPQRRGADEIKDARLSPRGARSGRLPPFPLGHAWIVPGRIAAGGHPDRFGDERAFLQALKLLGFDSVLSLCEKPADSNVLEELGFQFLHVPIGDAQPPTMEEAQRAVEFIRSRVEADGQIYVHCYAGYGRTGTIVAAYLIAAGSGPFEATREVRSRRPGSIETREQELFLIEFARRLRDKPPDREG